MDGAARPHICSESCDLRLRCGQCRCRCRRSNPLHPRAGARQAANRRSCDCLRMPRAHVHTADYDVQGSSKGIGRLDRAMDRDARDLTTAGAKPTPYFPPIVVNRAARRRPQTRLRVVLLNAAGGRKFREILACLKRPPLQGADVILLCEVSTGMKRMPGRELATELAEAFEMSCAYVREFGPRPPGIESEIVSYMGNAILSAAPFEEVGAVAMHKPPTPMAWPRRMRDWSRVGMPTGLVTRVKFGGEELTVGVAHLHSRCTPAERARQMATYLESFPAAGRAIFGGDLNTTTTELSSRAMMLATARQMIANPDRFRAPEAYEPLFDHLRE